MQEPQQQLDELVRAFRQEGIDFTPAGAAGHADRRWQTKLRHAEATIGSYVDPDAHQLVLDMHGHMVAIERAVEPIDWCAATWGPLLRVLDGFEPLMLSTGVGDLWGVYCGALHYVVRAIGGQDAVEHVTGGVSAFVDDVGFICEWPA